ncbi:MAG: hypothetical protein EA359_03980, partial [Balneolaceae bacterium]
MRPHILYGYWDHESGPDEGREFLSHVNVGKSRSRSVRNIIRQGIPAIPIITGFRNNGTESDWKSRLADSVTFFNGYSGSDIPCILLIDEPFASGWTTGQLETLVNLSKEVIGEHFNYGFTVTEGNVRYNNTLKLPENASYIFVNYYPFRVDPVEDKVGSTKAGFIREFERTIEALRDKAGKNTRFGITGQAFFGQKWRIPPIESPLWYAEAVKSQNDIDILLWFEWW